MWELLGQLLPEMVGLVITPAAIVGCFMLLGSTHPLRNVALFGSSFLVVYAALSVVVLLVGRSAGAATGDPTVARGWISLGVGVLFLVGAGVSWLRGIRGPHVGDQTPVQTSDGAIQSVATVRRIAPPMPAASSQLPGLGEGNLPNNQSAPGWLQRLADPTARLAIGAGLVLAVVNPNIAILGSGLGIIVTADIALGAQLAAVVLLLVASVLDFIVPTIAYLLVGDRGRHFMRTATQWLVAHTHTIGVVVLLAFGMLFTGRGLGQIPG